MLTLTALPSALHIAPLSPPLLPRHHEHTQTGIGPRPVPRNLRVPEAADTAVCIPPLRTMRGTPPHWVRRLRMGGITRTGQPAQFVNDLSERSVFRTRRVARPKDRPSTDT